MNRLKVLEHKINLRHGAGRTPRLYQFSIHKDSGTQNCTILVQIYSETAVIVSGSARDIEVSALIQVVATGCVWWVGWLHTTLGLHVQRPCECWRRTCSIHDACSRIHRFSQCKSALNQFMQYRASLSLHTLCANWPGHSPRSHANLWNTGLIAYIIIFAVQLRSIMFPSWTAYFSPRRVWGTVCTKIHNSAQYYIYLTDCWFTKSYRRFT